MIFMDHQGDGSFDHAITVVRVERTSDHKVQEVVLAVGSFDDIKDADPETKPEGPPTINNYAEEVTIRFAPDGSIVDSHSTWQSEPPYEREAEYSATNTLMDSHPNGRLCIARWGDAT